MEPLCSRSKAKVAGSLIWNHRVLEVTHDGPRKQQRRKGNVETNMTEHAMLLKQQSKESK